MLRAGASQIDITPRNSTFLYGYPHVSRLSTGVHDPLLSSSLYLDDGGTGALFIACDVIFLGRDLATRARNRIAGETGVPASHILISATHTHSGPVTVDYISNEGDPVVPKAVPEYLSQLENGIVEAGIQAVHAAQPALLALARCRTHELGTNRRDPQGPADPEVPLLLARNAVTKVPIACMLVCGMHPTVLHEDSTVISGDFPAFARAYLQERVLGDACPVVYHMGASGNQSPRHVTRANTLEEATRLGHLLGRAAEESLARATYSPVAPISVRQTVAMLVPARFGPVAEAETKEARARQRLEQLRATGASRQEIRTAECDWFGAEETRTLARAAAAGRLADIQRSAMPAEIQLISVGDHTYVGWPGEIFVEYGLALRQAHPNVFLITLANGELQGYIVTPEAAREGGYEASNAVFAADSGGILVEHTLRLFQHLPVVAPT
ncbi:MAG: hypothetical protein ACYC3X_26470 [Pirellulaceae bacterium]